VQKTDLGRGRTWGGGIVVLVVKKRLTLEFMFDMISL
jgi:hypothetical protein